MFLRIENLFPKKFIGKKLKMSFAENKTQQLWASFMPLRKQIQNVVSTDLYSMQIFENLQNYEDLEMNTHFTKWACVEVNSFENIAEVFETYQLEGGLYAVFLHRGTPTEFQKIFSYIFQDWMPSSGYNLDTREHFEKLGENYKNNDPNSEEEIWIPIKQKKHEI